MRLALVGDIHAYRLFVPPWELLGKALVGQANVWFNRRRHFDLSLLPTVLARVEATKPDLMLFSGDFTSIATTAEFTQLARTLGPIMGRIPTVAVPGNHDRYTDAATRGRRLERAFPGIVPEAFPHMRSLNDSWALLAIDTAAPHFFSSRGEVGPEQLAAARVMVRTIPADDGLVVLAHYAVGAPPGRSPIKPGHQLTDAAALLDIFHSHPGPVIFLHGHIHDPGRWRQGNVVDIDAGAPCQISSRFPFGQGFWQIDLPETSAALENVVFTLHAVQNLVEIDTPNDR